MNIRIQSVPLRFTDYPPRYSTGKPPVYFVG